MSEAQASGLRDNEDAKILSEPFEVKHVAMTPSNEGAADSEVKDM